MVLTRLRVHSPLRFSVLPFWGLVAELLALAGLLLGLSWAIVKMPGPVPLVLVAGIAAVLIWTLYPSSAVYTLAIVCPFGMNYVVAGLTGVEPADGTLLVALAVATILLLEGRGRADRFGAPLGRFLLGFWVLMVLWNSVSFYLGPANADLWKDPVRDIWYLYRGVWRDYLVFPVTVLCLANRKAVRNDIVLIVIVSAIVSAYAIVLSWQTHDSAMGPFSSKNGLAGFLVLVLPFAVGRVLLEKDLKARLLYACAGFIMFRALWLTASRGGMVAFIVSLVPFIFLVPPKRLVGAAMAGVVVLVAFVGMKGNILKRPNIRRYLTLSNFSETQNYQWREHQWALFIDRIAERPWLGSGSEVVEELGQEGTLPTAHNSYLGMTMRAGIPGTVAWVGMLAFTFIVSMRRGMGTSNLEDRTFWLGAAGLVLAWLTHGLVDNVLLMGQTQRLFWMVLGLAVVITGSKRQDPATSITTSGAGL